MIIVNIKKATIMSIRIKQQLRIKTFTIQDVIQYSKIQVLKPTCWQDQEIAFINFLYYKFFSFLLKKVHLFC